MRVRHTHEYMRRRLLSRSVVSATRSWGGVPCREWVRASNEAGYGRLWDGERLQYVHRLSHEVFVGPIPAGLDCLHRCDNPGCIEPRHLWCGTHAKGRQRGAVKGRPSSHRGSRHPLSKLDEGQAREIKARLAAGIAGAPVRLTVLAAEYGVSGSTVRAIRDGRAWGWLEVRP